eukprot:CAMPEP_0172595800 /NCGR_PEP_ID=MMETSP1068-20121228/15446_1 /TAXON_ID=35684 /ORGANISM="Pseudopedinella elastica, Strain CCMP716" /LENGTH=191 /DNA_ID=CAMNT_0013394507 /DNA_START=86 /DNA_END=662 /DNA_ORIENTATION=-
MGIGDSKGKIHDFNGPFSIGIDNFMVGCVWRYAVVKQTGKKDSFTAEEWDAAIAKADAKYSKLNHNICCQNCHHHTADAISLSGRPMGEGNLGLLNSGSTAAFTENSRAAAEFSGPLTHSPLTLWLSMRHKHVPCSDSQPAAEPGMALGAREPQTKRRGPCANPIGLPSPCVFRRKVLAGKPRSEISPKGQ